VSKFRVKQWHITKAIGSAAIALTLMTLAGCSGGVDTSSASYQDGQYIGSINYNPIDPSTTSWYTTFCNQLAPNGMVAGDNQSDWVAGCIDGMSQAAGT